MIRHCAVFALAVLLCGAASAQEGAAGTGADERMRSGRYAFVPVEEGTMRLDTATGEVSICSDEGAGFACRPVRDEGAAAKRALERIGERLDRIEERLAEIDRPAADPVPTLKDEEAVDRVMQLAERMMRRFFDMVEEMKRETEPDRT